MRYLEPVTWHYLYSLPPSLSLSLSLPLSRNGCGWLATTCEPSFTLPISLEYQWRIRSQSCTTSLADMPRLYASHRGKASPSWPIGMEKSVPTLAPYRRGRWPHCLKCSTTYSSSVVAIIRGALWFISNHETQKQKIENDLCTHPEHILDALHNIIYTRVMF